MPTPPRTSLAKIVAAGRIILETEGVEALTMQRVAEVVGVRPPSLYKRVRDRAALVRLIAGDIERELGTALDEAAATGDAHRDLGAVADAFRAYARAHPAAYEILFARLPEDWRLDPDPDMRTFDALFRTVRAVAGPDVALEAARTVVAWAHGFVSMELAGAFRLGGDVDEAFAFGIDRITTALEAPRRGGTRP